MKIAGVIRKKHKDNENLKKFLPYIFVFLWMTLIFFFSGQPGEESTDVTNGLLYRVLNTIIQLFNIHLDEDSLVNLIENIFLPTRKCAHFSLYFVLGLSVYNITKNYDEYCKHERILLAILFCLFYACTDEIHQYFVPGRQESILDVVIDTSGSLTAILLSLFIRKNKVKRGV